MSVFEFTNLLRAAQEVIAPEPPTAEPKIVTTPNHQKGVVAVREGYRLESLDGPQRLQRRHAFSSVRSFGQWLRRHADPMKVDILVSQAEIVAALYRLK